MHQLARLDHAYLWHPFTQMRDWLDREPIVIVSGKGAILRDVRGREYLDGNSSIWTNLHGHNHPRVNGAIRRQLTKIAHSSALGLANEPASLLAAELVRVANPGPVFLATRKGERDNVNTNSIPAAPPAPLPLSKVFFSDDGSTAMECGQPRPHRTVSRGLRGVAFQIGQGDVAVLLPVSVQSGEAGAR